VQIISGVKSTSWLLTTQYLATQLSYMDRHHGTSPITSLQPSKLHRDISYVPINRHRLIVPRCRLNTYGRPRAFRLLVRRSGTHCQMNSEIRSVMSTASDSSLKQSCSALTSVTSALEVIFNVMRSINPRFTYLLTYLPKQNRSASIPNWNQGSLTKPNQRRSIPNRRPYYFRKLTGKSNHNIAHETCDRISWERRHLGNQRTTCNNNAFWMRYPNLIPSHRAGADPGDGGRSGGKTDLKLKAFCTLWPNVKDLNEMIQSKISTFMLRNWPIVPSELDVMIVRFRTNDTNWYAMSADQMPSVKSTNRTGVCFSINFTYLSPSICHTLLHCTSPLMRL